VHLALAEAGSPEPVAPIAAAREAHAVFTRLGARPAADRAADIQRSLIEDSSQTGTSVETAGDGRPAGA
jgi:hypothetical protein